MGQSSSTNTSQSTTAPWQTAMPAVNGLLGQLNGLIPNSGVNPTEQGAINQLTATGQAGNPYTGQIGGVANNLLSGGNANAQNPALEANFANYQANENPLASNTNYNPMSTPGFSDALNTANSDITNQINGEFAGAGRSFSGMNAQALARGLSQGDSQMIANQYNQNVQNQQGAANNLFGAGNTTAGMLSNNNSNANINAQNGITAANNALSASQWGPQQVLAAQQMDQQLPASNLGLLANIGVPLAELGRTTNGTSTQQNDPSFIQDLGGITGAIGNLMPKGPLSFNF
jgi:hypothetical protein